MKPYHRRKDELSILDGYILWGSRVEVPDSGREAVPEQLHETHLGVVKLKALARSYVWWPNLSADVEAKVRVKTHTGSGTTTPLEMACTPWSRLKLDYAGPFQGRMFLVLVDAGSNWLDVMPVVNSTATVTIEKLRSVFTTHRIPEKVVTDNWPQFVSTEFSNFLRRN